MKKVYPLLKYSKVVMQMLLCDIDVILRKVMMSKESRILT